MICAIFHWLFGKRRFGFLHRFGAHVSLNAEPVLKVARLESQ